MSVVADLSESLTALAQETESQVGNLESIKNEISDQAAHLAAQLDSSTTGRDVAEAFSASIEAVEQASQMLKNAAQQASDYAEKLITS